MTWTLKLTDGDISFDTVNRLEVVEGESKVTQDARFIMRTQRGEDLVELDFGVDLLGIIGEPSLMEKEMERALKENLPGFEKMLAFESSSSERTLSVSGKIQVDGEVYDL